MSTDKRAVSFIKNVFVIGFGTIFPKLMGLIILPILTYRLSEESMGTYDLIETLISLLLPFVTLQISAAGFRFIIQEKNNKEKCANIITNILFVLFCATIISNIILFFIFKKIGIPLLILTIVYFDIDIINYSMTQIIRGFSKNKEYSISTIILSISKALFIFLLLEFKKYEIVGAIIALLISTLSSVIYLIIKMKIWHYFEIGRISKKMIKELLSYSWPMVPNSLSIWVLNASDRFVITFFLGIKQNAIYAVANKIPNLLSMVNSTFSMAWQENASINVNDKDINEYYSKMTNAFFRFVAGGCAMLIAFTPILFTLLIRGNYAEAYNQMPILFIAIFYSCLSSLFGGIYIASKKTKSVGITTILAAIINLLIDFFLIKKIGIYAGSISTLVSYIFIVYYRMFDLKKYYNIKYNYRIIIMINICLMIMSVICFVNKWYLNIINICFSMFFAIILNIELIKKVIINLNKITKKRKRVE